MQQLYACGGCSFSSEWTDFSYHEKISIVLEGYSMLA